ncbi:hypothetical protein ACCO45_009857 [Purpureocillium lilacinum]|uniref:Uncharacterized protein n=2 Tax=Purpureocillium lilacinum TaxID=33203 RepID=A0ACC4DDF1_PURLI
MWRAGCDRRLFRKMLLSLIIWVLTFSTVSTAQVKELKERAQRVMIGYRFVEQQDFDAYSAAGWKLKWQANLGKQIGEGIYTTAKPNGWFGKFFCIIYADNAAFAKAPKVWVPSKHWWKPEIDDFITSLDSKLDPQTTLRMSGIDGSENSLQMLIPAKMVAEDSLDIFLHCESTLSGESTFVERPLEYEVNYDGWANVLNPTDKSQAL